MAARLRKLELMKTRILFLFLVALSAQTAFGQQGPIIERVEILGYNYRSIFSAELQDALKKLEGQAYDAQVVEGMVKRIQSEHPDLVAEPMTTQTLDLNRIRLALTVTEFRAFIKKDNVNNRYLVESVRIEGADRAKVSDDLYAEMQNLVGKPFDESQADPLPGRLLMELQCSCSSGYKVQPGSIPPRHSSPRSCSRPMSEHRR
jgi:hypothetical protein